MRSSKDSCELEAVVSGLHDRLRLMTELMWERSEGESQDDENARLRLDGAALELSGLEAWLKRLFAAPLRAANLAERKITLRWRVLHAIATLERELANSPLLGPLDARRWHEEGRRAALSLVIDELRALLEVVLSLPRRLEREA